MHAVKTYGGEQIQLQKSLALVLMQINTRTRTRAHAHTHTHTHTHKGSLLATKQEALESVWVVQRKEKSLVPARKKNIILNFPAHSQVTITAKLSQFVFCWESCGS